jgi:4-aminobutyrate aminotransferase-like enzyme
MERLRGLGAAAVVEVRGVGAMIGVELRDKATAEAIQARCLADGVLVLTCGPDGNVLRLIPPLTITDAELDHGLDVLCTALQD